MSALQIDDRGAVQVWTLARPERMNALGADLVSALADAIRAVDASTTARCVVLTGAGQKAFSSGADLKERQGMAEAEVRAYLDRLNGMMRAIEKSPRVFIAAVNGVALGGGFELALACDLRVIDPAAEVALPEVSLAILPGAGGTQRLARIVGPGRAKDLILTARRAHAAEAVALGIATRVSPPGRCREDAVAMAERIAAHGPVALAHAKAAIDEGFGRPLDEALAIERRHYEATLATKDRLEGLAAFREKRPPAYRGQ